MNKYLFKILASLFVSVFCSQMALAQGLRIDPDEDLKISTLSLEDGKGGKSDEIKLINIMSLEKYMPPIKNQGSINSCVAWSVGYTALSMTFAKENGWSKTETKLNSGSALFIYNSLMEDDELKEKRVTKRASCSSYGLTITEISKFLEKNGTCKSSQFDTDITNCTRQPNAPLKKEALNYRIKGIPKVCEFGNETKNIEKQTKGEIKKAIKTHLVSGYPVVIAIKDINAFELDGDFYRFTQKSNEQGHAMVIIGYDDFKDAYLVVNSKGENWGNKGMTYMKYDDVYTHGVGAYRIIVDKEIPQDPTAHGAALTVKKPMVNYRGKFEFQYPKYNADRTIDYIEAKPQVKSDLGYVYELEDKDWEVGDYYQLAITETQANRVVYVFSVDEKGANVHFPRNMIISPPVAGDPFRLGAGESPMIYYEDCEIIIPGDDNILQKRTRGDDNIIILFAYDEIKDFTDRVLKVEKAEGTIKERFETGFGDIIIPSTEIEYFEGKVGFTASVNSQKTVIPMIITVEGE